MGSGILLLSVVFYFTLFFSVSELFASWVSNSLLLFEESVHMFADSVSFGINLWAEKASTGDEVSKKNKQLAQLIGTGVSCLTLGATLFVVLAESVKRLSNLQAIEEVDSSIMLGFGITLSSFHLSCLVAYCCGVNILHSHSHSHGHGHGDKSCHPAHEPEKHVGHSHSHGHGTDEPCGHHSPETEQFVDEPEEKSENLMSAMFHVFVDFLHSFLVIVTAIIVKLTKTDDDPEVEESWNHLNSGKIDAISSLLLCTVIFAGTVVLTKSFMYQYREYKYTTIDDELTDFDANKIELA